MHKIIATGAALAVAAAAALSATAPASAQPYNPWWYHHHHVYHGGYYHGGGWGPGAGLAAGVLGFAAGAAIANGISHNGDGHEAACYRAYRSYDARTDTYLGYDGYRHPCP